jgi:hypothetical protein
MADEALTNKEESREALAFIGRLVVIPLVTGALISRAITDPVLSFSLQVRGERGGCARQFLSGFISKLDRSSHPDQGGRGRCPDHVD